MEPGPRPDLDHFLERGLKAAFPSRTGEGLPPGPPPVRETAEVPSIGAPGIPEAIGGRRVTEVLGRGGMGIVLRAEDEPFGRSLAVKVLRPELIDDSEVLRRFIAEARVCGRLQHPGVVPVHEMGTTADGRPWFTMRLIEGRTFAGILAARASPADEREKVLGIFEKVCQTIAYAHASGVVHRDLKPANVMVGPFGEVLVMDWGLAWSAEGADESTGPGAAAGPGGGARVAGTPAYMAPEQARGRRDAPDPRSDVFALGAILCEILTGAPPYSGDTPAENLLAAAKGWLKEAHERLDACGADLELVDLARACLAVEPSERPASAELVAEAVGDYAASVAERAHRLEVAAEGARARAEQERRVRRRTLVAAAALVVAGAAAMAGYLLVERGRRDRVAEAGRVVSEALERAGRLRGEARTRGERGEEAMIEALAVLAQARTFAGSEGLPLGLDARLESAWAEANSERERSDRDRRMSARLDGIRECVGDDRDLRARAAAYEEAFRGFGLDVAAAEPAALATAIRDSRIAGEIVAALDEWSILCEPGEGFPSADRILEVLALADPDAGRRRLRALARDRDREAILAIAADPETARWPLASLRLLSDALVSVREPAAAIRALEAAHAGNPGDFQVNHELGVLLRSTPARRDDAVRHFSMALARRPENAHVRADLAQVFLAAGRAPEGLAVAEASVRIAPGYAPGWHYRGLSRHELGCRDDALADLDEAIRLDPGLVIAHFARGEVLRALGRPEEALRAYAEAATLGPGSFQAAALHGSMLAEMGRFAEAAPVLRRAVALGPEDALARYHLGHCLQQLGSADEAVRVYEETLRIDPGHAEAHCNLGNMLWQRGRFDEAVDHLRRGDELGRARGPEWRFPSDRWLALAMEHRRLAAGLDALDAAGREPEDAPASARFARAAYYSGRYARALALWTAAFDDEPALAARGAPSNRFLAACAAARLAADAAAPGEGADRTRRERQALAWLAEELDRLAGLAGAGHASGKAIAEALESWGREPALAPFRNGASAMDTAGEWRAFWRAWEEALGRK